MVYLIAIAAIAAMWLGFLEMVKSHDNGIRDEATKVERAKWEPALTACHANEDVLEIANETTKTAFAKFKNDTAEQRKGVDDLAGETTKGTDASRRLLLTQTEQIKKLRAEKAELLARRPGPNADAGKSCEQKLSKTEQLLVEARDERIRWTMSLPPVVPVAADANVMKVH